MQFRFTPRRALGGHVLGILGAALVSLTPIACAANPSQDYRLEVTDQPVAVGAHSEFNVKLVRLPTGEAVEGATITESHLEMTMPHYAHKGPMPQSTEMTGQVKVLGTPTPGLYRLMGDVSMPGTWKLDIAATIPGETQAIEATATFKAGK
jgi:hypothetical protein